MATQQLAKKGLGTGGTGGNARPPSEGSCVTPVRWRLPSQSCGTTGASSRAMTLTPMRPEEFAVPAWVLHVFEFFGYGGFFLGRGREILFFYPPAAGFF